MFKYLPLVVFLIGGCAATAPNNLTITPRSAISDKVNVAINCVKEELDVLNDINFPGPVVLKKDELEFSKIIIQHLMEFTQEVNAKLVAIGGLGIGGTIKFHWPIINLGTEYVLGIPNFPLKGNGAINLSFNELKLTLDFIIRKTGLKIDKFELNYEQGDVKVTKLIHNGENLTGTRGQDIEDIIEFILMDINNIIKELIPIPAARDMSNIDLERCIKLVLP